MKHHSLFGRFREFLALTAENLNLTLAFDEQDARDLVVHECSTSHCQSSVCKIEISVRLLSIQSISVKYAEIVPMTWHKLYCGICPSAFTC